MLRLEGFAASVDAREAALARLLRGVGSAEAGTAGAPGQPASPRGEIATLGADESRALWAAIGGAAVLAPWPVVWRISVPPTDAPRVLAALAPDRYLLDWGGGLIWAAFSSVDAARVRGALREGHATLFKAPRDARAANAVFHPQPAGLAAALAAREARVRSRRSPEPGPARLTARRRGAMQTRFTAAQLQDPGVAASEPILRKCVHCGFCTATCPTYVLLGDELDSPRGRIYLIKEMLENDRPASAEVVRISIAAFRVSRA